MQTFHGCLNVANARSTVVDGTASCISSFVETTRGSGLAEVRGLRSLEKLLDFILTRRNVKVLILSSISIVSRVKAHVLSNCESVLLAILVFVPHHSLILPPQDLLRLIVFKDVLDYLLA